MKIITEAERRLMLTIHETEQILGRALHYPRYCDDQQNFPGATDANGVCVGDHVVQSLAEEAAKRIAELEARLEAQVSG